MVRCYCPGIHVKGCRPGSVSSSSSPPPPSLALIFLRLVDLISRPFRELFPRPIIHWFIITLPCVSVYVLQIERHNQTGAKTFSRLLALEILGEPRIDGGECFPFRRFPL